MITKATKQLAHVTYFVVYNNNYGYNKFQKLSKDH